MVFKKNMCTLDRTIRVLLGLGLLYLAFFDAGFSPTISTKILLGILGLVNISSGFMAYCPVYKMAHLSTLKKNGSQE